MLQDTVKPMQLHWGQLITFVVAVILSYALTVGYRKKYVSREYHKAFSVAITVAYIFILLASWFLNLMIRAYLGFNAIVSFVDLVILITLISILVGVLGVYLAKKCKNS